ncbi:MAG: hypothetical protein HRU03_08760, partial [Nanoarchaeales archaeon]|nr:hypothetical protein [Nanoarchaeales archaeon]
RAFESFGTTLTTLILTESFVFAMMFIAMLIGSFAMFKGLLRFAFSKGFSETTFGPKEINVIALMLSVIGTTGIFFIFKDNEVGFISLFGGAVGLLFVLFLCTLIMRYFLGMAKDFENSDGALGKGAGWIAVTTVGVIVSLFFLVGYSGRVLISMGCKIQDVTKDLSCKPLGDYNIFILIYNHGATILTWAVFIAVVFGIIYLSKKNSDIGSSSSSSGSSSVSESDEVKKEEEKHVKNVKGLVKGFNESLKLAREGMKEKEKVLKTLQKALRGR